MINEWNELKNEPCYWWLDCLNYLLFFSLKSIAQRNGKKYWTVRVILQFIFLSISVSSTYFLGCRCKDKKKRTIERRSSFFSSSRLVYLQWCNQNERLNSHHFDGFVSRLFWLFRFFCSFLWNIYLFGHILLRDNIW